MKRFFVVFLALILLLPGCRAQNTDITMEDIVAAYEAAAYKKECYHPVAMGLFSAIYGQPAWPCWKVYGCVIAEYDDPDFYAVFQNLLKGK